MARKKWFTGISTPVNICICNDKGQETTNRDTSIYSFFNELRLYLLNRIEPILKNIEKITKKIPHMGDKESLNQCG